jgi:hypothetical protein
MKIKKVEPIFQIFFNEYKILTKKKNLDYVITSRYRLGNPLTNPHSIRNNAIDFTLRLNGDYAPIKEYNQLFAHMMDNWFYRAGIDNTWGNIHVHIDLGRTRNAKTPYFFKEDNGKFLKRITDKSEI